MVLRFRVAAAVCGATIAAALLFATPHFTLAATGTQADGAELQDVQGPPGLWLTTPYPMLGGQAGGDISIDLTLANQGLEPQRVEFDVTGLPEGWHWEIDGDGRPVGAAIATAGRPVALSLKLTPAADAAYQAYDFAVVGRADGQTLRLPISLNLTETEPARLTLTPTLPALRGTVRSTFDFQIKVTNEGQEDTVINLVSQAEPGFEVTFKERYGSQELTSLPLGAGQSKDMTVSVKPAQDTPAGQYPVMIGAAGDDATAQIPLMLDITGHPTLSLSGPDGRLSGDATAGEDRTFTFALTNTGTAPAETVKMAASPPQGWKVSFAPEGIPAVQPGETVDVAVTMTPSNQAIAGDYVVAVRSNGDGTSDNASFRVTVRTSTIWGIVGLGVIGAAVVVLVIAVARYGRR
ncbi:MAG: NEW3 domain-containing protein [Alphaproteobacteria bacterium]